jgi:MATE family multidrug resistance protein
MQMQQTVRRFGRETTALLSIAWPLIINNLSVAGMQFTDAVMAGQLGAESLAAVAVGGSVWFLGFAFVLGVLMAISPISARHHGAGDEALIGRYTRQGVYLGIFLAIPIMLFAWFLAAPALAAIGIDVAFRDMTVGYVKMISLGGPGMFIFLALRFTTEGIGYTKPIMYTSIFALACNVFLNWVFMFGKLGAPAMGAVGCGLASGITMWIIAIILATYMVSSKVYEPLDLFSRLSPMRPSVLKEIVFLGVPIAITITAEAGLFNAVSILMGTLGPAITAAHQIALNFASTMFMIPLAINSAITVRVGYAIGKGDLEYARFAGGFGIFVCAVFMACSATFLLLFRDAVVSVYTQDPVVKGIAISLLLMATVFQVADGIQIGAAGALRGYKDTRVPMAVNIFAYWIIAFPLAYLAAVTYKLPPNYIWGGFVAGLSVAAVMLTWRYAKISGNAIRESAAISQFRGN